MITESTNLLTLLTVEAPYTLMKLAEAIRDNDATRQHQEWRYLRSDNIVQMPFHDFIEELNGDIDTAAEIAFDKWPYSTGEASCGTCGDFNPCIKVDSVNNICYRCYAAENRVEYLNDLIIKLTKETAVIPATDLLSTTTIDENGIVRDLPYATPNWPDTEDLLGAVGVIFIVMIVAGLLTAVSR